MRALARSWAWKLFHLIAMRLLHAPEHSEMNIYIGNLPDATTEEDLSNTFSGYGKVISVSIIRDRHTGKSHGYGFIDMPENHNAVIAVDQLNGQELGGRFIKVTEAWSRTQRSLSSK